MELLVEKCSAWVKMEFQEESQDSFFSFIK